jgi:RimJ/RimL family protein N-acetyltransferase
MSDVPDFTTAEQLKDGTPVTIRVIRPDDKGRIVAAFRALEPETIYTRYFQYKTELTDEELRRATEVDFVNNVALVVTIGRGKGETIIGGARYVAYPGEDTGRSAEIAFTVEEDYQGQGIASSLLRHLIRIARDKGLARFVAEVLPSNGSMLGVFSRCGLPMKVERLADVVHVTLELEG